MMPDQDESTRWAIVVIHGIGDTEPGHTVDALTWTLDAASTGFEARGEPSVLHLSDPAQSDPTGLLKMFPVHMRRGRMRGIETVLVESYWADLSRIRGSRLATALGLFRVILNLHHPMDVGAAASNHPAARLVRGFLHGATWLLRGPIAALNLFLVGIYLVGIEAPKQLLAIYLAVSEAPDRLWTILEWRDVPARALSPVVLVVGSILWRRTKHTDGTWAALWLSLAVVGVFGTLGALVVRPDVIMLARGTLAGIGISWLAWLCLMGLALLGVAWEWWSESSERRAPLAEAAVLAVVQAGLWAVVVTLMGYFLVDRALDLLEIPGAFDASREELESEIGHIYRMLVMQLSSWAVVFGVAVSVAAIRWRLARMPSRPEAPLPRLIVSPAITVTILAICATSFVPLVISRTVLAGPPNKMLWGAIGFIAIAVTAVGSGFLAEGIRNVLHIGMDIINHFHRRVLPWPWESEPRPATEAVFERRRGIEARFCAVLERVAVAERPTHLTVVGHSQGTMIAVDVLANRPRSLDEVEVSLLTMGSPLTHLYERYFPHHYGADRPNPLVERWINVYRLDDYIGTVVRPGFSMPENHSVDLVGLDGHAHYWRQLAVARHLAKLAPVR